MTSDTVERLEFRPDERGKFDEIVARFADGMVHVETMSKEGCYVGFYWDDGRYCQWWIHATKKGKLSYNHEDGDGPAPRFTAWGVDRTPNVSGPTTPRAAAPIARFAPGPWNVQRDGQIWCDDHPIVEKMCRGPWGDEAVDFITGKRSLVHHWGTVASEQAKANANLIASAPDLYAALDALLTYAAGDDREGLPAFEQSSAALRKARGEPNVSGLSHTGGDRG